MFPELSLCVNGQESEYPFSVNAYESEYSKIDESGNIYESGKLSSSVNLVLDRCYRDHSNFNKESYAVNGLNPGVTCEGVV